MIDIIEQWMSFFAVCLAVAAVSLSITKATVSAPLRKWMAKHSKFFGELFSCPYCFSHWVSAFVVIPFAEKLILTNLGTGVSGRVADIVVAIFAMVAVSCIIAGFVIRAFEYEEDE